jgi:hypothetical protein
MHVTANREMAEVLRRCLMPAQEIGWVLTTDDPSVVHMLIELHSESLRENLADRLTDLREVEASITSTTSRAAPRRRLDQLRRLRPPA